MGRTGSGLYHCSPQWSKSNLLFPDLQLGLHWFGSFGSQNGTSFSRCVTKIPLNWKLIATWPFGLLMLLSQQARKGLLLWTCWDGDADHQVKISAATTWWGAQRELSCDLWILMIITCKCRLISCEHCTSLGGSVDKGGSYASVWGGSTWEVSAPSSQLCCEPKTTLKFVFVKLMENYSDLIHRSFINRVLNQPDA